MLKGLICIMSYMYKMNERKKRTRNMMIGAGIGAMAAAAMIGYMNKKGENNNENQQDSSCVESGIDITITPTYSSSSQENLEYDDSNIVPEDNYPKDEGYVVIEATDDHHIDSK